MELPSVDKIIAGINPDMYAERASDTEPMDKSGFKKALKNDFWKALEDMGKYNLKPSSSQRHKLVYDSSSETLEPIYFWILDKMNEFFGGKVKKLVDNFASSPGGGHFTELMQKAQTMQAMSTKIMGDVNTVIKSIVTIIYDLKEFEIRISQYKYASSKNKDEAEAGLLALKQIWMDNVDMKRGQGSINALTAGNLNFVTLRDAFMMVNSLEDVKNLDLNDRVKRILEPRVQEFLKWRELSERELIKRYEIEKTYLRSQLNALKLYTRWAKPYFRAATQLEQQGFNNPALVTAFNTIVFQLSLFGKRGFDLKNAIFEKKLPVYLENTKLKRGYNSCVLIDFTFRGIPQRVGQHFAFGGLATVTFNAYALNDDELKMLDAKMEESDINDALKIVQGLTDDSIKQLQEDIDYFLQTEKKQHEENTNLDDTNPFSALLGFSRETKKEEKKEVKIIKPDNYIEKLARNFAESGARETCYNIYDIYKKAHAMPSLPWGGPNFEPRDVDFPGKKFWGLTPPV